MAVARVGDVAGVQQWRPEAACDSQLPCDGAWRRKVEVDQCDGGAVAEDDVRWVGVVVRDKRSAPPGRHRALPAIVVRLELDRMLMIVTQQCRDRDQGLVGERPFGWRNAPGPTVDIAQDLGSTKRAEHARRAGESRALQVPQKLVDGNAVRPEWPMHGIADATNEAAVGRPSGQNFSVTHELCRLRPDRPGALLARARRVVVPVRSGSPGWSPALR